MVSYEVLVITHKESQLYCVIQGALKKRKNQSLRKGNAKVRTLAS